MRYHHYPFLRPRYLDSNGDPLSGGKLYSYEAGTTNPLATYSDKNETANSNPIILNSNGEVENPIYLGEQSYKFILTDADDVEQWSEDDILITDDLAQQLYNLENIGFSASVNANALTFELKQADGSTDLDANGPAKIAFDDLDGSSTILEATSGLSITIPDTASLGHGSGLDEFVFIYLVNNGGVLGLAVSSVLKDENTTHNASAISASSDNSSLYGASAFSGRSIRLLGRVSSNQTTSGTWASAVTGKVLNIDGKARILDTEKVIESAAKTPGTSGDYLQMTNNSVSILGTWEIEGGVDFNNGGSSPTYTVGRVGWYSANGADSNSEPSQISGSNIDAGFYFANASYSNFTNAGLVAQKLRVTFTQSTTIYLVPSCNEGTPANARVTCYGRLRRIA
jgi:hypothetical protein